MFRFGRRKHIVETPVATATAQIRMFEVLFFPDGTVLRQDWIDAPAQGVARPEEGKIENSFEVAGVACKLDATLRDGDAIFSMWAGGKIVTSSLLISSSDEAFHPRLIAMYLQSQRGAKLVKELAPDRNDLFIEVEHCAERPMLATMLMPAPSTTLTDALLDVQRNWAAAAIAH
ncbi:hypothetical protein UB44_06745 [Burkholderiaceae bacterium 26]|uniref:hypothetical protein n=1 Tax=Ralstonia sp. Ralssp135 TaxID=3243016 RepID=UPI0005EB198C|nr:hypothetical protein UB44_06745 [Burkholderiaceae bacterium 26]